VVVIRGFWYLESFVDLTRSQQVGFFANSIMYCGKCDAGLDDSDGLKDSNPS
jgi:hypothetical protein